MGEDDAREIMRTIRHEVEQAADMMLSAAEKCLKLLPLARSGDAAAHDSIERTLCAILEACAFQDLTGQRLSKLETMIGAFGSAAASADPLLNGPALQGEGLTQAAADRLMNAGG